MRGRVHTALRDGGLEAESVVELACLLEEWGVHTAATQELLERSTAERPQGGTSQASSLTKTSIAIGFAVLCASYMLNGGAGLFILTYYVAAAFSGLLFARLVGSLGRDGAGLWQLTLSP
ncbi:hypothetical protein [Nonomuraea cypriaca]|uniref:hypothetical protein n=1 Tax=Nonomuraea cypriaca TaxID=1187855 RepID=UPI001A9C3FE6|nr:hypothetical protein [Nonomuraea cypriaca]